MPSVYVKTLGCKVNTFDSRVLENLFKARGFSLQTEADQADVMVVNTCSVTANADREARYLARRLRRENPHSMLVFTGCYAQTDSARLVAMDEVDVVVPNQIKERLVDLVDEGLRARSQGLSPVKLPSEVNLVTENRQTHFKSSLTLFDQADSEQTRAFVKIQDGCNGFCSYCLIPYARGQSRSVPGEQVIAEVRRLIGLGTYEIVLTGIHIGDYGRDLPSWSHKQEPIVELIEQLFNLPHFGRLRISSLEPGELSPALVALLSAYPEKVCQHLHLPLQSGSDPILKAMRRTYNTAGYRDAVERIRKVFPEVAIGADVIPGFPGESDQHFAETLALIKDLNLSYLHVFPYSLRPNTSAAKMPGHVNGATTAQRATQLRGLSTELSQSYARNFIGKIAQVVWEKHVDKQGRPLGRAGNYLTVAASLSESGDSTKNLPPKTVSDHDFNQNRLRQGMVSKVFLKGLLPAGGAQLLGRVIS